MLKEYFSKIFPATKNKEIKEHATPQTENNQTSSCQHAPKSPPRQAALKARQNLSKLKKLLLICEKNHIKSPTCHGWNYENWRQDIEVDPYVTMSAIPLTLCPRQCDQVTETSVETASILDELEQTLYDFLENMETRELEEDDNEVIQ